MGFRCVLIVKSFLFICKIHMQFLCNILQEIQSHSTIQSLVLLDKVSFKCSWLKYGNSITNYEEKEKRKNNKLIFRMTVIWIIFLLYFLAWCRNKSLWSCSSGDVITGIFCWKWCFVDNSSNTSWRTQNPEIQVFSLHIKMRLTCW